MTSPIAMFKQFIAQDSVTDMFITGPAGTGKTTELGELIEYCKNRGINYMTCAYTHKACRILRSKLPPEAKVGTLHKFLRKRPVVNTNADKEQKIQTNAQFDDPKAVEVLFIDEFSMVGERDLMNIRELQDSEDEEKPDMKIVWIGDLNQLPPVKDQQTITPHGKFWSKLEVIHRQAKGNPLLEPLIQLVSFIEKREKPSPLVESDHFIRNCPDLVDAYIDCHTDKVFLAFTNQRVQEVNFQIEGKTLPEVGDKLFCPTLHKEFTLMDFLIPEEVEVFDQVGEGQLEWGTKYKTLETIVERKLADLFIRVEDEDGTLFDYPIIFGTANYKRALSEYGAEASKLNREICKEHNTDDPTGWARANWQNDLARKRAKAWSNYLSVNQNVLCFDFNHAITVHKSQGSTFTTVFLDAHDLAICMKSNYDLYLKLMYVALSRASNTVVTN